MNIAYVVVAWGLALILAGHWLLGSFMVLLILAGSVVAEESR